MRILVVDDERAQRESLAGYLKKQGHSVATAESAQTALAWLYSNPADLVLSDFKMPYMSGKDLLDEINERHPGTVVILLTAYGTVEIAVDVMKAGAWDFLSKPVDLTTLDQLIAHVDHFLQSSQVKADEPGSLEGFETADSAMRAVLDKASKVSSSNAGVLITGETGVGKEVLARFIHDHSPRRDREMIAVNCAALPSHLIESELFGHIKGSFTGAVADRVGRFEEAEGSTLFLDEIGDLPVDMQVKLLRFLQSGEFQRIGESSVRSSDVRIVAATNVDLEHAMERGEFREDLYFRLNVIHLHIPPLRERPADIRHLSLRFLEEFSVREGRQTLQLSAKAEKALLEHAWPGNVRELRNILERAVLLSSGDRLEVQDLDLRSRPKSAVGGSLPETIEGMERELISRCLGESGGNQSACARKLGISERVLRYKLQKYQLK